MAKWQAAELKDLKIDSNNFHLDVKLEDDEHGEVYTQIRISDILRVLLEEKIDFINLFKE